MTLDPDDRKPAPFLGGLFLIGVATVLMLNSDEAPAAAITLLTVGIVLIGVSRRPL